MQLAVSLWRFWLARGHFAEGGRWLEATLAAAPERTPLRARALLAAAAMEVRRGDPTARVRDLAVEAAAIMREVADDKALAQILHLTGLLAWVEDGAWEQAVRLVEEGRSLAATAGDAGMVASATHMLGVIALMRGAAEDAERYLSETLGLLDRLPADLPPFFSAVTPGWFWELGPGGQPRMPFTETVLLYRRVGTGQAAAYTLSNLAYAVRLGGEPARARTLVEQSLGAFQRQGDLHGEGLALCHLANLHRLAGELSEAGELLGRSLEIRRRLGDRRGVGLTVVNQGLVAAAAGDLEQADRLLREALLLFEEMEDGPGRWGALRQPRPGPARRRRGRPGAAGAAAVARAAAGPLQLPPPGVDPAGHGRAGATGRRRGHGDGLSGGGTTPLRRTGRRRRRSSFLADHAKSTLRGR